MQLAPTHFRVLLGTENLHFNEGVYMDIIHINHAPILHLVEAATKFIAARFLSDDNISTFWAAFVEY